MILMPNTNFYSFPGGKLWKNRYRFPVVSKILYALWQRSGPVRSAGFLQWCMYRDGSDYPRTPCLLPSMTGACGLYVPICTVHFQFIFPVFHRKVDKMAGIKNLDVRKNCLHKQHSVAGLIQCWWYLFFSHYLFIKCPRIDFRWTSKTTRVLRWRGCLV